MGNAKCYCYIHKDVQECLIIFLECLILMYNIYIPPQSRQSEKLLLSDEMILWYNSEKLPILASQYGAL